MLEALRFVKGAIAPKGSNDELAHFRIENGTIKGFNGSIALCSPIDLDLDITPKAIPFMKAVASCKDTTAMSITKAGRVSIKSGKFKAFIECTESVFPEVFPEGDKVELDGEFIKALQLVAPFVCSDNHKLWATGVLLDGQIMASTNNVIIVQYWLKTSLPMRINLPAKAVRELIRIKENPTHVSCTDNSATFYYDNGRWLRTNLIDANWPDTSKILDKESNPTDIPKGFFEGLKDIAAFSGYHDRVYLSENGITTSLEEGEGASVEMAGLYGGCFSVEHLSSLEKIATSMDFQSYPAPCLFFGDSLRGAVVGMKV